MVLLPTISISITISFSVNITIFISINISITISIFISINRVEQCHQQSKIADCVIFLLSIKVISYYQVQFFNKQSKVQNKLHN